MMMRKKTKRMTKKTNQELHVQYAVLVEKKLLDGLSGEELDTFEEIRKKLDEEDYSQVKLHLDERDDALTKLEEEARTFNLTAHAIATLANELSCREDLSEVLSWVEEDLDKISPGVREILGPMILSRALSFRDADLDRDRLWCSLRILGVLLPATSEGTRDLIQFLRVEDKITTKQAALHTIQSIYTVDPPPGRLPEISTPLLFRVKHLFEVFINPDVAIAPEFRSLAISAGLALLNMRPEELPFIELKAKEAPWLFRAIHSPTWNRKLSREQ